MIYKGEKVHCATCGGTDMRFVQLAIDVLIECRGCRLGMLGSEFNQWKDDWKNPPKENPPKPNIFRRLLNDIHSLG